MFSIVKKFWGILPPVMVLFGAYQVSIWPNIAQWWAMPVIIFLPVYVWARKVGIKA